MNKLIIFALSVGSTFSPFFTVLADGDDAALTPNKMPFSTLDARSKYFTDAFPEPLRLDDTTLGNELRFDWQHAEGKGSRGYSVGVQVEKSINVMTFQVETSYSSTRGGAPDAEDVSTKRGSDGFSDVALSARVPILQNVSKNGWFDNTFGVELFGGIPTHSPLSKNVSISPAIFDDLALGDHFSIQTLLTYSYLFGSKEVSRQSLEYGIAFAWAIEDEEFKVPKVERLVPLVEFTGDTALDGSLRGHNALTGTAGLRIEFKPVGKIQPQLGIGYIFPIDKGGRDELRWGVVATVTFEL